VSQEIAVGALSAAIKGEIEMGILRRSSGRYYHCYTCDRDTYQKRDASKHWVCDGNTQGVATTAQHDPNVLPDGVMLGFSPGGRIVRLSRPS